MTMARTRWKPRHGWTYLADRTVAFIALALSCGDLLLGQHLWSVALVAVSIGATAHGRLERLERAAAARDSEKTGP